MRREKKLKRRLSWLPVSQLWSPVAPASTLTLPSPSLFPVQQPCGASKMSSEMTSFLHFKSCSGFLTHITGVKPPKSSQALLFYDSCPGPPPTLTPSTSLQPRSSVSTRHTSASGLALAVPSAGPGFLNFSAIDYLDLVILCHGRLSYAL